MGSKPKKLVLIGLDAPTVEDILRYSHSGDMPVMARLIQGGTFAENCLVPFPTITPPNWTSIVTGAFPGTHGITCFHMHDLGEPLNVIRPAFDSRDCRAEYIWEAAERVGKASIILNYPSTWPPRIKLGVQVGGAGLSINEWRLKGLEYGVSINGCQFFSTEEYPQATQVQLRRAAGWANLPSQMALECELPIAQRRSKYAVNAKSYYLLILPSPDGRYRQCALCRERDFNERLTLLEPNQWSPILSDSFETNEGIKEGVLRVKLLELSEDGRSLKLYMTASCEVDGWSHPEDVARSLPMNDGMPLPAHETFFAFNLGWIDDSTFIEELEMHHRWLADAAEHLMRSIDWTLFFMHAHCPDWIYHSLIKRSDPLCMQDANERSKALEVIRKSYVSIDRMIEQIISAAGEDVLIVIVSDHGALPSPYGGVPVLQILRKAGLLAMKVDEQTGREVVDWEHTKAFPQRSVYIYVNLKGRNPNGIVEPGEEYERVRDEIIDALLNWRDPKTGMRPIIMAMRREDVRSLGIYGEAIGDVVYAIRPGYGGEHGQQLATAQYSRHSMRGLLILFGPGIKSGYRMRRTVWLTDIVPTVCSLMDLPYPRDCEGAVLYQALTDVD